MARRYHSDLLETRTARLALPVAKKPVFVRAGKGVSLGYRRNRSAGTWVVRAADGAGGNWTRGFGVADDFDEANGTTVFDYWQAQARARAIAVSGDDAAAEDTVVVTVARALDNYELDVRTRGGDIGNVGRVRHHLPAPLGEKAMTTLSSRELRRWRDDLAAHLAPATVNRTSTALKAALNLAAEHDARITSRRAWETGLASIPDAEESRNVILIDEVVRAIIVEAYGESEAFGVLVEVAAVTGARVSQLARIEVQDVQDDRPDPRLMMPSSRKGRGTKKVMRRPVPIPVSLASRLRTIAASRTAAERLLSKPSGAPWNKSDHSRLFRRVVKRVGLDPTEVTIYALRHSSIVRQLLGNVPARVVAVNHDTSIAMLERTYSRQIGDHSDALARRALLDPSADSTTNVVALRSAGGTAA